MDCLMYVQMQGVNLAPKVKELEKRIEMLENVVNELKLDKPRMGRPPKDKHGTERLEVNTTGRN
jgi:hypothetical protein